MDLQFCSGTVNNDGNVPYFLASHLIEMEVTELISTGLLCHGFAKVYETNISVLVVFDTRLGFSELKGDHGYESIDSTGRTNYIELKFFKARITES